MFTCLLLQRSRVFYRFPLCLKREVGTPDCHFASHFSAIHIGHVRKKLSYATILHLGPAIESKSEAKTTQLHIHKSKTLQKASRFRQHDCRTLVEDGMSNCSIIFYVLLSTAYAKAVAPTEANGPDAFRPLPRIVEASSAKGSLPMKPHLRPSTAHRR